MVNKDIHVRAGTTPVPPRNQWKHQAPRNEPCAYIKSKYRQYLPSSGQQLSTMVETVGKRVNISKIPGNHEVDFEEEQDI